MTIWTTVAGWFGGAQGQQSGQQLSSPITRVYENAPDVGVDGAMQISAVWACVELITDNISSLPLFVYTKQPGGDGHKEIAREASLWRLFMESPNRRHTPIEFFQFIVMSFLLRGNAYARIVRDAKGEAIELLPLSADQMEVTVANGNIQYEYIIDGKKINYSERDVFHWRDKGNGIIGMSRLDYMRSTVGVAIAAQNHNSRSFSKNGKRPGVFSVDKLMTAAQRQQVRDNYSALVGGAQDDLLILEQGARFDPLALSPQDMQLLETRRFSIEDIARWFGISSVLINDTTKATTWGTGIDQLIEGFYKFRLRPLLESLEQAIERRVLTPRQRELYSVEFSLDAIMRGSLEQRLDLYAKAVQNGIMTRNEARQLENWPRIEGGDELTAQSNLMPVEMLGQQTGGRDHGTQDAIAQ